MKSIAVLFSLVLIIGCKEENDEKSDYILYNNVNIIDVKSGKLVKGKSVVVKNDIIHNIIPVDQADDSSSPISQLSIA